MRATAADRMARMIDPPFFFFVAFVLAIALLETVKPRRVVRQDSLGQFRRTSCGQEVVDQRFVAKTTIRRKDGATHMLVVRRRVWPVATPHAAIGRNL